MTNVGEYGTPPPGFRLPAAARVGAVRLQVSDLGRSIAYYERVIGLRILSSGADAAILGAVDATPLVALESRPGLIRSRRGAFGLYHFAILLPDRPSLGRFAAHVSSLGVHVGMADHLVSEALYLWDPDGLGIEVYADRPRDRWQRRGRELAMTTDPLDLGGIVAEGGGEPWTGAPAGTTMGHVHLHVGSLEAAEAFFHAAVGFDKVVWSYPGALFLSAGGYHHHLGTNVWSRGPAPAEHEAKLLEWEIVVPDAADAADAGRSLRDGGHPAEPDGHGVMTTDPWGTRLRIRAAAPPGPARSTTGAA